MALLLIQKSDSCATSPCNNSIVFDCASIAFGKQIVVFPRQLFSCVWFLADALNRVSAVVFNHIPVFAMKAKFQLSLIRVVRAIQKHLH